MSAKLARRLRDPKLVELLAESELEKKTDFADKKKLQELVKAIEKAKLNLEAKLEFDEEHSLHELVLKNGGEKPHQLGAGRHAGIQAPAHASSGHRGKRQAAVHHRAQWRQSRRRKSARQLLNYVLEDAKKEFTITRFKGLGEMNPEQLWATTMNAETRTLLKVRLEDAVAAEDIFSTLMGENVEERRKFIEENALDVVNLDI